MIIDHQIIEKSQDDEEEGGKGPSKGTWTVVLGAQLVESKKQELLSIKTISLSQDVECGKLRLSISKLLPISPQNPVLNLCSGKFKSKGEKGDKGKGVWANCANSAGRNSKVVIDAGCCPSSDQA